MSEDPTWETYRLEAFGEPYLVWHDGPDFAEVRDRFERDPALAIRMLTAGLAEDDALAAHTPRELDLDEQQRATLVELLRDAVRTGPADVRVQAAASLFALTGSPEWSAPIVQVLGSTLFWSVRIDAAILIRAFPPTVELVDALAAGVRDGEYLVRYHSAETLLAWSGRPTDIASHEDLFRLLVDDAGPNSWAVAAERLAAAVEV